MFRLLSSPAFETKWASTRLASKRKRVDIFMKRRSAIALFLVGFAALSYSPQASSETGWVTLFDGKNLDNFDKIGDANWRVEDGVIVADKGNGFLVTKNSYADYQIRAEFWVDPDANSGIFIRCSNPEKVGADNAYEVNIWDMRPDPSYGTGAIVNLAKVDPMPKAAGKWNVYEITAKGSTFTVVLNGQKTVDGVQDAKFASGRIALQHGPGNKDEKGVVNDKGVVKFRKLEIKPL
jgi:3-keto-disaccharide hydrolase